MAKASVLGANAAVNGQSVNQGLGNSVLTEYKVYVNPYLVVTPFRDWMDYTKHYYMGAIRVASELGGTPCLDPNAPNQHGHGAQAIPNPQESPCTVKPAVSAEWELADVLKELSIIEVGDENQEGWEDLIASRDVEFNMTESEFTTWMEQNCPPEYAPIPPPGSLWETPREGSPYSIAGERCACELSAYWAELLYGIECDDYRLLYWYHPDYLGHVELVTDPLGNPYQYFFYGAFGDVLAEQNTPWGSFQSAYQFNGKETDSETGYGYYGARYYAPEWSVWLSVDPLAGEFFSVTPFHFVANNPINIIDPDGRDTFKINISSQTIDRIFVQNSKQHTYLIQNNDGETMDSYTLDINKDGFVKFPESGPNWGRYGDRDSGGDNWAQPAAAAQLLGLFYDHADNALSFFIHFDDISGPSGYISGHTATHTDGRDIDIRYPGAGNGENQNIGSSNCSTCWNSLSAGGMNNEDYLWYATYSFLRTADLWGFNQNYVYPKGFPFTEDRAHHMHRHHLHIGTR